MAKEIKLESRGNLNNRLVQVDNSPNKYQLITDYNYRAGLIEGNTEEYSFIDPAGGPFISVGSTLLGKKVKAIYKGGIIEFEE